MDSHLGADPVRSLGVDRGADRRITDDYLKLQTEYHQVSDHYGTSGFRWAPVVLQLCAELGTNDVLDYGCGKATLNLQLPFTIKCYDPCIPKYAKRPKPARIVVCCDVMEHIEEEFVEAVFDDLKALTRDRLLLNISLIESLKTMPDGRNPHITIRPASWWLEKIEPRWKSTNTNLEVESLTMILAPP